MLQLQADLRARHVELQLRIFFRHFNEALPLLHSFLPVHHLIGEGEVVIGGRKLRIELDSVP